jgi:hypothetical protein
VLKLDSRQIMDLNNIEVDSALPISLDCQNCAALKGGMVALDSSSGESSGQSVFQIQVESETSPFAMRKAPDIASFGQTMRMF